MTIAGDTSKVYANTTTRNWNSYHRDSRESDPVISDEAGQVLQIIFYVILCGLLGVLGVVANVINIVIFCKQGFKDSVNISLVSLALSDLGILITIIWKSICHNPLFRYSNIEFDSLQVEYLTAGWTNGCCVRTTTWITAFITFEKCACIALPMKVKDIITPKRTVITVVVIYCIMFTSPIPFFSSVYFLASFSPGHNRTLIGVTCSNYCSVIENVTSFIHIIVQISGVITVIICSVVLIINLQMKLQWREKISSVSKSQKSESFSSRDKKIMKIISFISCTFIGCYLPGAINLILIVQLYPDYSVIGKYHNLYTVTWSVICMLEAVNSSINIFFYYNFSSNFREASSKLLCSRYKTVKTT